MKWKKLSATLLIGVMIVGTLGGCGSTPSDNTDSDQSSDMSDTSSDTSGKEYDGVTLTLLKNIEVPDEGLNAVIELAHEKLGLTVEVEERVGGADGDNIVKTRLASGDMSDICIYNSGSLFMALNPSEYFYDISNEDFAAKYEDAYTSTVSVDGAVYGIPQTSTQVGGIIYSKPIYEELDLEIPKTWDEFLDNCKKIKEAGYIASLATYGDGWSVQVPYLADNYNVLAENPDFPEKFEAGEAKYASTPAGVKSFQKIVDMQPYFNEDYLSAVYEDGIESIANGEAGHWLMLTQALTEVYALYPEKVDDLGVFGIPGEDADNAGITVWQPDSLYINKNAENIDAILAFMELYISDEGLDVYASALKPNGPYAIKGHELPDDAYEGVKDLQAYFDEGKIVNALEFMTAVKGSNCAAICQEAASGQTTAEDAAAAYDEDCMKQAIQLGLDWE